MGDVEWGDDPMRDRPSIAAGPGPWDGSKDLGYPVTEGGAAGPYWRDPAASASPAAQRR